MPANLENSAVAQGWKKSLFIPVPKKGNAKNVQTTAQLHSSHTLANLAERNYKYTVKLGKIGLNLVVSPHPPFK